MDRSYISLGSIGEYFGNTVVKKAANGKLIYLREMEFEDTDDDFTNITLDYENTDGSRGILQCELEHYDDLFDYISPWLPAPFNVIHKESGDSACIYCSQPNHYKRSFSSTRYVAAQPHHNKLRQNFRTSAVDLCVTDIATWTFADRSLEEAFDGLASGFSAIDRRFGLCKSGDMIHLTYHLLPIGVFNNRFQLRLHPKYYEYFARELIRKEGFYVR